MSILPVWHGVNRFYLIVCGVDAMFRNAYKTKVFVPQAGKCSEQVQKGRMVLRKLGV